MGQGSPKELVKAHGKTGLEKGRGSPRKANGQGCPRGKWDTGARKQCNKRPSEHTKSLGGKQTAGLKRPSKIELNNIIAGIVEVVWQEMLIRPQSEYRVGQGKEGP